MQIPEDLYQFVQLQKNLDRDITLVTGVFDILHSEHLKFLEKAKAVGGVLVVGLESDVRVRKMKGEDRPINSQEARKKNLESLGLADFTFILPEQFSSPQDHDDLIAQIHPRYLAVSSHTKYLDKKEAILKKYGGEVLIVHEFNPDISTTKILEKGRGQ